MSGGAFDYSFRGVSEMGMTLKHSDVAYRKKFGELLMLVAIGMHDVEWTDSGDYSTGDDEEAIQACFDFLTKMAV